MLEQTYKKWLGKDVAAAKYALIVALEKRDNLLYIEKPELKEEYMQKIGGFEEQVLSIELEVSLQEKKIQLIQTAINRREPVDLEKIEEALTEERANKLNQLNQTYRVGADNNTVLRAEEKEELQKLYRKIVGVFHPQVRNDMTETQRVLYDSALEAYRKQNLEQLRLAHDMLFDEDGRAVECAITLKMSDGDLGKTELEELTERLMNDYSLAGELYPYFDVMAEDAVFIESRKEYMQKQEAISREIDGIMRNFPFTAKSTMADPEKVAAYLQTLEVRMNTAKQRVEKLQSEIAKMLEGK